ncbi:hypothetical protein [Mumia sp. DW29H23]|uniref:hypothetical protein n=1 Tax=Mumia sp. DW29H23 TaxID=3421241 RepID=UPI003D681139
MPRRTLRSAAAAPAAVLLVLTAGCTGGGDREQEMPEAAGASATTTATTTAAAPTGTPTATPAPVSSPYCDAVVAHRDRLAALGRDAFLTDAGLRETVAAVDAARAHAPRRVSAQWDELRTSLVDLRRGVASAGLRLEDLADADVTSSLSPEQRVALRRTVRSQRRVPEARATVVAQVRRACRVDLSAP